MWRNAFPINLNLSKKIHSSKAFVNNKNQHPSIGDCISVSKISFEDSVKKDEWKFCFKNKKLVEQIESIKYYDDIIIITH